MAGIPPVCDLFLRRGSGGFPVVSPAAAGSTTGYKLESLRLALLHPGGIESL
jgi:hypothetical protein